MQVANDNNQLTAAIKNSKYDATVVFYGQEWCPKSESIMVNLILKFF